MAETLLEKLSKIQVELKAPKNQWNDYGSYKYRSCEDILEAVKPICNKNRTTLVVKDEVVTYGDRFYIKAIATLYDWDSQLTIETSALARETLAKKGMDDSQITGSTSSYARKYALNGLFNIDDTKDGDSEKKENENAPNPKSTTSNSGNDVPKTSLDLKHQAIWTYYGQHKETFGPVLKGLLNKRKLSDLSEDEIDGLLEIIETSTHTMEGK